MKKILTAYLMGGLGNQMFQISHAISQGIKNNIDVEFKNESFTPMQAKSPEYYRNNIFKNIKFVERLPPYKIVKEKSFNDSGTNQIWNDSVMFYGYFQSSKNFLGYDNFIKKLFQPDDEFVNFVKSKYPQINNEKTLSLHVRRGDYLTISHVLPVIDKSYIEEAITQNGEYDTLFIFSDDTEWVKNNLFFPNQIIISEMEDYQEMWMISLCKNNIMSNSSFSWWGSFLNKNVNKKVFAPNVWFGPSGEKVYHNIYEPDWNLINVKYKNGALIYEKD